MNPTIHTAIEKLQEIPECKVRLINNGKVTRLTRDGMLGIQIKNYKKDWPIEVTKQVVPAMIPQLKALLNDLLQVLVIAEYITPQARKMLRNENIAYADGVGNIYLTDDGLYVFIETNERGRKQLKSNTRAFTKAGLKVLYVLLMHPEYINEKTYRFLENEVGVALDTINKTYKALQHDKYLIPKNKNSYEWNNRKQLLIKWANEYVQTLKPKLNQRKFRAVDKTVQWKDIRLPEGACWGGENAGEKYTNYLIANHWTVYANMDTIEPTKQLKWIPDPEGNITVIEKFWKDEKNNEFVTPLLAYADLLEDNEPRKLETAEKIYNEYLQNII
jgi:hypothetical protein